MYYDFTSSDKLSVLHSALLLVMPIDELVLAFSYLHNFHVVESLTIQISQTKILY